jgi:MFS family permease
VTSVTSPLRQTLSQPNYRRYAAGNAVSLIGTWIQRVAVGWLAWELTGSATWLGIVAFADLFPVIVLGPIGGATADRRPALAIVLLVQIVVMVLSGVLTAVTAMDAINIYGLTALVLAQGIFMGFGQPARLALVYQLVPRENLANAVAFNSVVFNLARFVGPVLAGGALVASGAAAAFAINTLSFIAFIIALMRIELPVAKQGGQARSNDDTGLAHQIWHGARYAFGHARIGPLLLLASLLSVAVRPYVELFPAFADEVFNGDAGTLAIMSSSVGLGAMVAGLAMAARRPGDAHLARVFVSAGITALSVLWFALTESYPVALFVLAVSGGAMVITGVTVQTALQLSVDTAYRARVMSLYGIMFRSGPALGALVMGIAADSFGLRAPLAIGAVAALTTGLLYWRRVRS